MPHCGGQTVEALRRMGEITGENILRVLRGEEPLYQV
jgi:lactate dehydrogenase-like 2-hydroxyacid dehydrogenase